MATKIEVGGIIDPNLGYTLAQAANAMGVSPRYLRETLIDTGEIRVVARGRSERVQATNGKAKDVRTVRHTLLLITGREILRYMADNEDFVNESA